MSIKTVHDSLESGQRKILAATPGQRARFNSPITARQRVKKIAVERELEEAPTRAVKPPKDDAAKALSDQARDLEGENEHLRERLAAAESAPHREAGVERDLGERPDSGLFEIDGTVTSVRFPAVAWPRRRNRRWPKVLFSYANL